MSGQASVVVSDRSTPVARRPGALYWLALGTFAIGTEGFMTCDLAALTLLLLNHAQDARSQSEHVASPNATSTAALE
jgi:hypothetical protein